MVEAAAGDQGGGGSRSWVKRFWKPSRISPVWGLRGGTGQRAQGLLPSKVTSPMFETDDAADVVAEELVFPESGDAVDFERGAETLAGFVDGETGEPVGDGVERRGGDDGGAAGDGVVGDTVFVVTDHDVLVEEYAEPLRRLHRNRSGNAKVRVGISRRSPGTERVTFEKSGA